MDADPAGERGRQHGLGKQLTDAPGLVHRGKGRSTSRQVTRKRGRPVHGEGSGLNGAAKSLPRRRPGCRSVRESDRVIVPLKPGNAGGGKDPDFWCVFEANEVR
jgi:hypothetical protein